MLKDRFGHEVFIGCTVVYPGRAGSSCWLATGVVEEILPEAPGGRYGTRLKLNGGTRGNGRDRDWHTKEPKPPPGKRTVMWTEEVIVLGA